MNLMYSDFLVLTKFTTYRPSVRSVLVKYWTVVFSTDQTSIASRGPCRKTGVLYFNSIQTEQARSMFECSVKTQLGCS